MVGKGFMKKLSELHRALQSYFSPDLRQESRRIANGLGKSSQEKQTTQDYYILVVKLDSALMCFRVVTKN